MNEIGTGRRGSSRVSPSAKDQPAFACPDTIMINLLPHEAKLIQSIHALIAGEAWFNRNAITELELLKLILRHHACGSTDMAALLPLCRDEARLRFSKPR